jgi:hypothetical protein
VFKRQCFSRFAEITRLVAEVRALVEGLPDTESPSLILRHYDQVERTVANFVSVGNLNMQQFMEPLQDTGLLSIEMADHALRRNGYRATRLDQSELDRLREEAHDLLADVLGADGLTAEQKRSIVAHLKAVEDTLVNALLSDEEIVQANDGLIGSILALPHRAFGNHAVREVAKFAAAVATAVAVNIATQAAETALEPPKPSSVVLIERIAHGDEIPAITSGTPHEEVVDAEIVEDSQPGANPQHGPAAALNEDRPATDAATP